MGQNNPTIAVIGGTGHLGSGLARVWAAAGYPIVIGSRSNEKAVAFARTLHSATASVRGDSNSGAAVAGEIIVLAVPYSNHSSILDEIRPYVAGKIVVDATVPLASPNVSVVHVPSNGSPAVTAQRVLGSDVRVVSAFHNVGAKKFQSGEKADCDVLVFGDDDDARRQVIALANIVASRGVDGGSLANSVAAEALTAVLIGINRRYKVAGAGIRITGLRLPHER